LCSVGSRVRGKPTHVGHVGYGFSLTQRNGWRWGASVNDDGWLDGEA